MMTSDRPWSEADRELVRPHVACGLWWCTGSESCPDCAAAVAAVLDALTAAGWHDLSRVSGYLVDGKLYDPRDVQILTPTEADHAE